MTQQRGKRVSLTRLGLEPARVAGAPGAAPGAGLRGCVADVRLVAEPLFPPAAWLVRASV